MQIGRLAARVVHEKSFVLVLAVALVGAGLTVPAAGPAGSQDAPGEGTGSSGVEAMSEHQAESVEDEGPGPLAWVFVAIMGLFLAGLATTAVYLFYRAAREEF